MPDEKPTEKPTEKQPTMADLKQMAHDYAVPISEGTLKQISQDLTPEKAKAFEEYIKTTAQGLYPTLAPQIKAGIPTAYLLDPYRQVAKQVLGDHVEPDFTGDPNAGAALTGGTDPNSGRPAPMSLDQWKGHLMSNPAFGFHTSQKAHDMANNAVQGIIQQMSQPMDQGAM